MPTERGSWLRGGHRRWHSMVLDAIEQSIWSAVREVCIDLKDVVHHLFFYVFLYRIEDLSTSIRFSEPCASRGSNLGRCGRHSSDDNALAEDDQRRCKRPK